MRRCLLVPSTRAEIRVHGAATAVSTSHHEHRCTLGAAKVVERITDRVLGRLLFSNSGVKLVAKAFEAFGGDYLNTFLRGLRSTTATIISKSSFDIAVAAASKNLCQQNGLCNPAIDTRSVLTGANASLVTPAAGGAAQFICPARTPTSPPSYRFTAAKDICGDKSEAQADVACAGSQVTLTMGDNGSLLDDIYELRVDGRTVLTSSAPVRSVSTTVELSPGRHTLQMLGRAAPDGVGTFFLRVAGATVVSGPALSGSDLTPGVTKTYTIEVP